MTDAKKYQSETLAEDVQEPKFCIDLSWPWLYILPDDNTNDFEQMQHKNSGIHLSLL